MGFFGNMREAIKNVATPGKALEENRAVVDRLVEEKLNAARQFADNFVGDKVQELKGEAMMMVDMLEERLDIKLAEMEKLIDARLKKEIYWKLVGLRWTLLFVLITSGVGIGYTLARNWIEKPSEKDKQEQSAPADDENASNTAE